MVLGDITHSGSYAFSVHAVPTAMLALAILAAGAVTVLRAGRSRASLPFAALMAAALLWMWGASMVHLSADAGAAGFWARIATSGLVFLPAAALAFTLTLIGRRTAVRGWLAGSAVISSAFLASAWVSPQHIAGVAEYWWGYHPRYGAIGWLFVIYSGLALTACLYWSWRSRGAAGSAARRRVDLLLTGLGVAAFSALDYLAAAGVAVYPIGFAPLSVLFAVLAFLTWRHSLPDITPALASQRIIDTMTDALVVTDDQGRIRLTNPAACDLLGAGADELANSLFQPGAQLQRDPETRARLHAGETLHDVETCFRRPDGETRTLNMSASLLSGNGAVLACVYVLSDITARRQAEERIRFLAYNDALTKLPNRLYFDERLGKLLDEAGRAGRSVTVLFLDIDRFKRINDTLGHDAGDELLCAVANRLSCLLVDHDIVSLDHSRPMGGILARLGGDEFALALDDVTQIMEVRRAAQSVIDAFMEPFTLGDQDVFVGTSIGIAQFPRDGSDVHQVLKNADMAMYHAKDAGRNCYKFYNDSMSQVTLSRLDLEADLRKALDRGQFEVHYQPQVDIRTGRIFGAEALLRWHHPERGAISPADFVPLAEETGLIIPIGQWVLQEACTQTKAWHDAGFINFKVAVNLSERQFRQNTLVLAVSQALARSGLDPAALELELTEGTIMRNAEDTVFSLSELKAMGMHISVDDFGTGYSSLSYLKRFPIDVIKIDRSFVQDICDDPDDAAITASIIAMARSLKRNVIAEGVETMAQAHALRDRGCNFMQGYLFSKPVDSQSMGKLLEINAVETSDANVVHLA